MSKSRQNNKEIRTMSNKEIRTMSEVRMSDDNSRTVRGYAAVFGKRSQMLFDWGQPFYEEIAKGAFDDVLGDDVRALLNHDPNHLLARTKSGTLRLWQDDKGLGFEFDIPLSREDVSEMIQRGDLDQNSFAFFVEEDEWRTEGDDEIRTIKKIKRLQDVTLATYPAYPDAKLDRAQRSWAEWKESEEKEEDIDDYMGNYRKRVLRLHELNG